MRTTTYHLYSSGTTAGAGDATANILRKGRIIGFAASLAGVAAAGDALYATEVMVNSTAVTSVLSNNPSDRDRRVGAVQFYLTTGYGGLHSNVVSGRLDIPVEIGDVVNINRALTGTAAATLATIVDVYVLED